ncbi:MAG: glycoside hydrolase family 2 [Firmicutes bacterium]|uniref:Glycoside hydrolase family 2 n=1 Tax=Candidatus Onthovivens merdipullorum TaxID=2840889 RepID=A0A9D9DJX0_9BACL|nr:glycoside hydrolase family 2 [Candidatus Onthovivens merdipullorum]
MIKHTLSYHKGHPNPSFFRKYYELLNGEWDFYFDKDNTGLIKGYQYNFPIDHLKIKVPYPYQTKNSGINKPDFHCDTIWYHKNIEVHEKSDVLKLIFLGVDYETFVYVNSKLIYTHQGGYDSFNVDIAPFIHIGTNNLTLRVVDKMNIDQIRGKQRWKDKSFECFYTEVSGIYKDVYLEKINAKNILDFKLKNLNFNETLLSYHLSNYNDIQLKIEILFENCKVFEKILDNTKVKNNNVIIKLDDKNVHLWSVDNHNLYDVKLTLLDNKNNVLDEVLAYFGINIISTKNKHIYLNNKDTYFKLILDQGYYKDTFYTGSEKEFIDDIKLMKEMGFNGCRKHQKIESPLFYYYADILGYLLWQELPSPHAYSYNVDVSTNLELFNQINDHYNHPSIVTYVIFNESWGVQEIYKDQHEQELSVNLYNKVKETVPNGRLVISNDGWEHTKSDIISLHNYGETYDSIYTFYKQELQKMFNKNESKANLERYVFAKNYTYNGEPIMLTEFGGIAYSKDKDKGWGYGNSVKGEKEYIEKLTNLLKALKDIKEFRGYCLTQLSDVEIEVNGLVNFNRDLKVNIEDIKKLNDMFE